MGMGDLAEWDLVRFWWLGLALQPCGACWQYGNSDKNGRVVTQKKVLSLAHAWWWLSDEELVIFWLCIQWPAPFLSPSVFILSFVSVPRSAPGSSSQVLVCEQRKLVLFCAPPALPNKLIATHNELAMDGWMMCHNGTQASSRVETWLV